MSKRNPYAGRSPESGQRKPVYYSIFYLKKPFLISIKSMVFKAITFGEKVVLKAKRACSIASRT